MTKRDYIAIAALLKGQRETAVARTAEDENAKICINCSLEIVARGLADLCERDNRAFDRARFLTACGVQS